MTGIDTNIIIDLIVDSSPHHQLSVEGISKLEDEACTTPTNVGECLWLLTHSKVFLKPMVLGQAVVILEQLFDYYKFRILDEPTDWWKELVHIEKEIPGIRGNEIFDARIALCLKAHSVKRIYTRGADFRKYSFLKIFELAGV